MKVIDSLNKIANGEYPTVKYRDVKYEYDEKDKEIERLNNIINELEAHCDIELNRLAMGTSHTYEDSLGKTRFVNEDIYNEIGKIKYFLQELKGSNKE